MIEWLRWLLFGLIVTEDAMMREDEIEEEETQLQMDEEEEDDGE